MTRKKLNKFLTENYNEIIIYDRDSIREADLIEDLARRYIKEYNDVEKKEKLKFKESKYKILLTDREMIDLARDIINSIDSKLLSKFDKLVDNEKLVFERNYPISEGYGITNYNIEKSTGKCYPDIYIDLDFSYFDVMAIIHEFMHYLSLHNKKMSDKYGILSEITPIYFEEYAWDVLMKKGIKNDKLNLNRRIINTNKLSHEFLKSELVYLKLIEELGKKLEVSEKTYNKYKKNMKLVEKRYLKRNDELDYYSYITGTILAYYAKENCSKKDMLEFTNNLNDKKYSDYNLRETLKTIGIKLDDIDGLMKPTKKILSKKIMMQKGD